MAYESRKYVADPALTASNGVLIESFDLTGYDKFCMLFQNENTAAAFIDLRVQAAINPSDSAITEAPIWVEVNTATIPSPSALGVSATVLTSSIESCYKWLRVIGRTNNSAAGDTLSLTVAGHRRR